MLLRDCLCQNLTKSSGIPSHLKFIHVFDFVSSQIKDCIPMPNLLGYYFTESRYFPQTYHQKTTYGSKTHGNKVAHRINKTPTNTILTGEVTSSHLPYLPSKTGMLKTKRTAMHAVVSTRVSLRRPSVSSFLAEPDGDSVLSPNNTDVTCVACLQRQRTRHTGNLCSQHKRVAVPSQQNVNMYDKNRCLPAEVLGGDSVMDARAPGCSS